MKIKWESNEPEDRTGQAVALIREATLEIQEHYTNATEWPGWHDDALDACLAAKQLLSMALPAIAREMRGVRS